MSEMASKADDAIISLADNLTHNGEFDLGINEAEISIDVLTEMNGPTSLVRFVFHPDGDLKRISFHTTDECVIEGAWTPALSWDQGLEYPLYRTDDHGIKLLRDMAAGVWTSHRIATHDAGWIRND